MRSGVSAQSVCATAAMPRLSAMAHTRTVRVSSPAVLSYRFAERCAEEQDKVAPMVLIGSLGAAVFLPLALVRD